MSLEYFAILTERGKAKLAAAIAGGTVIELKKMALGDGDGNPTTPNENQTELVNEVYRANLSGVSVAADTENQVICQMLLGFDVGGFTIREAGIYDADDELFAVANYPDFKKSSTAEGAPSQLTVKIYLYITNLTAIDYYILNPGREVIRDMAAVNVTVTPEANTSYIYDTLASLTINTPIPNSDAETLFSFYSGATPTVLTLPALTSKDAITDIPTTLVANSMYEISIRNGKWAINSR